MKLEITLNSSTKDSKNTLSISKLIPNELLVSIKCNDDIYNIFVNQRELWVSLQKILGNKMDLETNRLSLLVGTMMGQISELLNQVGSKNLTMGEVYQSLKDIHVMTSLQIHEIYYKDNAKEKL